MLSFSGSLKVFVAIEPCDLRQGFNGLHAAVSERLQEYPRSGALFVFSNRRHTRLKILYWDQTGLWILTKRLEEGTFAWPKDIDPGKTKLALTPQALAMLLMRFFVGPIMKYQGYRRVLLYNTVLSGILVMAFATMGKSTPVWLICTQVFVYGFVMSLQYTAMNTLGFVDLAPAQASMGSSMTSTVQNLSMSFGIAFASLLMALFLQGNEDSGAHYVTAFRATMLILGGVTVLSALMFLRLPRRAA